METAQAHQPKKGLEPRALLAESLGRRSPAGGASQRLEDVSPTFAGCPVEHEAFNVLSFVGAIGYNEECEALQPGTCVFGLDYITVK